MSILNSLSLLRFSFLDNGSGSSSVRLQSFEVDPFSLSIISAKESVSKTSYSNSSSITD